MLSFLNNKIITIEGADATGKNTIADMLHKKLKDSIVVYFPNYDNVTGKRIKAILKKEIPFPGELELQSLQLANKVESIVDLMYKPQYRYYIFCRDHKSAMVYAHASGLSLDILIKMGIVLPESYMTFILSGKHYKSFDTADSEYYETTEKQKRISELYLELAELYNWTVIDNNRTPEAIVDDIFSQIKDHEQKPIMSEKDWQHHEELLNKHVKRTSIPLITKICSGCEKEFKTSHEEREYCLNCRPLPTKV